MADISDDLFFAGLSELRALLQKKEISAVELARTFCDRFEKLAPRYNALALSLRESALSQAKDVDSDIKIGRLSISSPLAKALLGKKKGDMAMIQTPAGNIEFEITDLGA